MCRNSWEPGAGSVNRPALQWSTPHLGGTKSIGTPLTSIAWSQSLMHLSWHLQGRTRQPCEPPEKDMEFLEAAEVHALLARAQDGEPVWFNQHPDQQRPMPCCLTEVDASGTFRGFALNGQSIVRRNKVDEPSWDPPYTSAEYAHVTPGYSTRPSQQNNNETQETNVEGDSLFSLSLRYLLTRSWLNHVYPHGLKATLSLLSLCATCSLARGLTTSIRTG